LRVGGGVISSHKRRERSEVYAHNSSKPATTALLPAAPPASDAIAYIVALNAGSTILICVMRASSRNNGDAPTMRQQISKPRDRACSSPAPSVDAVFMQGHGFARHRNLQQRAAPATVGAAFTTRLKVIRVIRVCPFRRA
jgi:hypothetical protein